jgi:hypothetical protein
MASLTRPWLRVRLIVAFAFLILALAVANSIDRECVESIHIRTPVGNVSVTWRPSPACGIPHVAR